MAVWIVTFFDEDGAFNRNIHAFATIDMAKAWITRNEKYYPGSLEVYKLHYFSDMR